MATKSERFVPMPQAWFGHHRSNFIIWTKSTTNPNIYFLYFCTFSTFPAKKERPFRYLAPLRATKSERQATKSERQATTAELFDVAFPV